MGLILGKITVETPKYTVVASGEGYEVREYGRNVVAEVEYDASGGTREGFMVLASYIGALGKPNNVKKKKKEKEGEESSAAAAAEKIAMTAPVVTEDATSWSERGDAGEKVAMTAPVLTGAATAPTSEMTADELSSGGAGERGRRRKVMQFVLPASKYSRAEDAPAPTDPRVVVKEVPAQKYGALRFNGGADEKLERVKASELRQALVAAGFNPHPTHLLAQYNPPWTIPYLRTNEILIPLAD